MMQRAALVWVLLLVTVPLGCGSDGPGGGGGGGGEAGASDASIDASGDGLGPVTECLQPGVDYHCLSTAEHSYRPLCCPQAGPLAPRVMCSMLCSADGDCTDPTAPHCSHPPSPPGGPAAAGLCMPAGQDCCWNCR
jgi:hypothetical protein